MEVGRGSRKALDREPEICPTDSGTIAPKRPLGPKKVDKQSLDYVLRTGLAGGLAACAAKTVVGPLDRVKILFQASNPHFAKYTGSWFGVVTAMRDINRQDGLRGLFRGHSATLLRIFPYAAIKFLAYEQVRAILIKDKSQETPLRRLVSGAVAGVTSVLITYPLEVIRVRLAFETSRASRSSLSSICKQIYHERPPIPQQPSSVLTPTPSSSLPVRAAASTLNSAVSNIQAVSPRSGLANFYRGFAPTLLGMLPYAGMSFLTHDTAGDWLRHPSIAKYTTLPSPTTFSNTDLTAPYRPRPLKYWAELLAGGLAGLVSQSASYPLEVIRRRIQVGGAVGDGHRLGMAEITRQIWKEKGFKGFWVGLTIGYVKVVPMVAVSFLVYERGKLALGV
ncbi:mitochondrial carrier protein leu5 [Lasallia pustulata]|uniref:Mitochondrial thiamine pyrophosphate carrier 1 n=1 Tax=Lasallia pustulata TaxID=136370 RepID=A0A1W5D7V6_9LECA|nr:mitochondrial carrier protein leu5 [Lasallia pustulata]